MKNVLRLWKGPAGVRHRTGGVRQKRSWGGGERRQGVRGTAVGD